uniref:Uncharacterized protein n=1 Tax=Rhizophora mucronata TaxID=61149 RepID=A0A2P2KT79_RHIMU
MVYFDCYNSLVKAIIYFLKVRFNTSLMAIGKQTWALWMQWQQFVLF